MKKYILILSMTIVINMSSAQVVKIFKGGFSRDITVKMISDQGISSGTTWINIGEYDSLQILTNGPYKNELERFRHPIAPSPIVVDQDDDNDPVVLRHQLYMNAHTSAKALELVGVLLIGGGLAYQMQYQNNALSAAQNGKKFEAKKMPVGVPIAGIGCFLVGITIDIGAGEHLKKR
jgi:hypothetical protein